MRNTSCHSTFWPLSAVLLLCVSVASLGQDREKFVISAKAGGINAVTGQASVHGRGESEWQQLMVTDDLNAGDSVRTAGDGRVEILLNPGSYLRVGGNSEVELANNSLANLEVRLLRGTAIVEATGGDGTELMINITTPHAKLAIVRQGLYRLNVVPENATELIVRKGRVILNDSHTKVKGGNKVVFSAASVFVAKLSKAEKENQEDVENWSKERAGTLAKANRRISDRMLTSAFASFGDSDWSFLGSFRSSGFWFYNTTARCYTFLPLFGGYWGSPYGSSYRTAIYNGVIDPRVTSNVSNPASGWPYPNTSGGATNSNPGNSPAASLTGATSRPASGPRMDPDSGRTMRKPDVTPEAGRPIQP